MPKLSETATALKGCTRPRQFAARIFAMPTAAERQAALAEVPAELRTWVEEYLRDWWMRQRREGKAL